MSFNGWTKIPTPLRKSLQLMYCDEDGLSVFYDGKKLVVHVAGKFCRLQGNVIIHDGSDAVEQVLKENVKHIIDWDHEKYYMADDFYKPYWLEGDISLNIGESILELTDVHVQAKLFYNMSLHL